MANEVKDLAQETSRATDDIARHVETIRIDTEAAVAAISRISGIIAQINDTQSTIASAVEQQTDASIQVSRRIGDASAEDTQPFAYANDSEDGDRGRGDGRFVSAEELISRADTLQEHIVPHPKGVD